MDWKILLGKTVRSIAERVSMPKTYTRLRTSYIFTLLVPICPQLAALEPQDQRSISWEIHARQFGTQPASMKITNRYSRQDSEFNTFESKAPHNMDDIELKARLCLESPLSHNDMVALAQNGASFNHTILHPDDNTPRQGIFIDLTTKENKQLHTDFTVDPSCSSITINGKNVQFKAATEYLSQEQGIHPEHQPYIYVKLRTSIDSDTGQAALPGSGSSYNFPNDGLPSPDPFDHFKKLGGFYLSPDPKQQTIEFMQSFLQNIFSDEYQRLYASWYESAARYAQYMLSGDPGRTSWRTLLNMEDTFLLYFSDYTHYAHALSHSTNPTDGIRNNHNIHPRLGFRISNTGDVSTVIQIYTQDTEGFYHANYLPASLARIDPLDGSTHQINWSGFYPEAPPSLEEFRQLIDHQELVWSTGFEGLNFSTNLQLLLGAVSRIPSAQNTTPAEADSYLSNAKSYLFILLSAFGSDCISKALKKQLSELHLILHSELQLDYDSVTKLEALFNTLMGGGSLNDEDTALLVKVLTSQKITIKNNRQTMIDALNQPHRIRQRPSSQSEQSSSNANTDSKEAKKTNKRSSGNSQDNQNPDDSQSGDRREDDQDPPDISELFFWALSGDDIDLLLDALFAIPPESFLDLSKEIKKKLDILYKKRKNESPQAPDVLMYEAVSGMHQDKVKARKLFVSAHNKAQETQKSLVIDQIKAWLLWYYFEACKLKQKTIDAINGGKLEEFPNILEELPNIEKSANEIELEKYETLDINKLSSLIEQFFHSMHLNTESYELIITTMLYYSGLVDGLNDRFELQKILEYSKQLKKVNLDHLYLYPISFSSSKALPITHIRFPALDGLTLNDKFPYIGIGKRAIEIFFLNIIERGLKIRIDPESILDQHSLIDTIPTDKDTRSDSDVSKTSPLKRKTDVREHMQKNNEDIPTGFVRNAFELLEGISYETFDLAKKFDIDAFYQVINMRKVLYKDDQQETITTFYYQIKAEHLSKVKETTTIEKKRKRATVEYFKNLFKAAKPSPKLNQRIYKEAKKSEHLTLETRKEYIQKSVQGMIDFYSADSLSPHLKEFWESVQENEKRLAEELSQGNEKPAESNDYDIDSVLAFINSNSSTDNSLQEESKKKKGKKLKMDTTLRTEPEQRASSPSNDLAPKKTSALKNNEKKQLLKLLIKVGECFQLSPEANSEQAWQVQGTDNKAISFSEKISPRKWNHNIRKILTQIRQARAGDNPDQEKSIYQNIPEIHSTMIGIDRIYEEAAWYLLHQYDEIYSWGFFASNDQSIKTKATEDALMAKTYLLQAIALLTGLDAISTNLSSSEFEKLVNKLLENEQEPQKKHEILHRFYPLASSMGHVNSLLSMATDASSSSSYVKQRSEWYDLKYRLLSQQETLGLH